jgi:hypothetical protein
LVRFILAVLQQVFVSRTGFSNLVVSGSLLQCPAIPKRRFPPLFRLEETEPVRIQDRVRKSLPILPQADGSCCGNVTGSNERAQNAIAKAK